MASYFPHFVFTTMPFDPIRDVQSTVDMVEQLRRAHGAVPVASNQPSQTPNFIHQTVDEAIQSEARVEDRLTRRDDSPNSSGSEDLFLVTTTRQMICIETPK